MKTFKAEFQVYFEDISPSGRVHLEKLAEWLSMAREKYFRRLYSDPLEFIDGPVRMFTTNMALMAGGRARWADRILVSLTSANVKKISFEINADFKNARTGETIATGTQKVAFIDASSSAFSSIPEDLKRHIVEYQKANGHTAKQAADRQAC